MKLETMAVKNFKTLCDIRLENIPRFCVFIGANGSGKTTLFDVFGFLKDPFIDRYVSDGTLKMFAYLVLLNDPYAHPLLCVEEPENQLYPDVLSELAEEFAAYADRGGQVFVSTHSPDFLNAVEIENVFQLKKGEDGYAFINRACEDRQLDAYMKDGARMGELWKEGWFGRVVG